MPQQDPRRHASAIEPQRAPEGLDRTEVVPALVVVVAHEAAHLGPVPPNVRKLLHELRECLGVVQHVECVGVLAEPVQPVRIERQGALERLGGLLELLAQVQRLRAAGH